MNQTPHLQASARRAPPQLFGSPTQRHPDFEESILATIDGRSRSASAGSRTGFKGFLLLGAAVLAGVLTYWAVQAGGFSMSPPPDHLASAAPAKVPAPQPAAAPVAPVAVVSTPMVESAPPVATASVETLSEPDLRSSAAASASAAPAPMLAAPAPAAPAAPALEPASVLKMSPSGETEVASVAAASEAAPEAPPIVPAATPSRPAPAPAQVKQTRPRTQVAKAGPSAPIAKRKGTRDADAELLAAMLPYLSTKAAPTSSGLEKRCGQTGADISTTCRAKYCNGREGSDAACPLPSSGATSAQ